MTDVHFYIPILSGTVLFGLLVAFIIYFMILYRKNQIRFELENEKLKHELLKVKVEIQEETLNNVSRELHDNFGHTTALINLNLSTLNTSGLTEKDQVKIETTKEFSAMLVKDLRSLSGSINGDMIKEKGWLQMIQMNVDRINRSKIILFNFTSDSVADFISIDAQLLLYRVIQEMTSNALKHAKANALDLTIKGNDDGIQITFKDNGVGYDSQIIKGNLGSGLQNMKERCNIIGAQFECIAELNNGVTYKIQLRYD
jgi:signal transduction histidine kinase